MPAGSTPRSLFHSAPLLACLAGACVAGVGGVRSARAQEQSAATSAGVRGVLTMRGERVHRWREGDVTRVVLDGNVRLTLGQEEFSARRASAWIRTLGRSAAGEVIDEVYVTLEEAGSGDWASGAGVESSWLPIRGVVVHPGLDVTGDALFERAVTGADAGLAAFLTRSDAARAGESPTRAKFSYTPPPAGDAAAEARGTRWRAAVETPAGADSLQPAPKRGTGAGAKIALSPRETTTPRAPVSAPAPAQAVPSPRATAPAPAPSTPPAARASDSQASPPPSPAATSAAPATTAAAPASDATPAEPARATPGPLLAKSGMITLAPGDLAFVPGDAESLIIASNGVTLLYRDAQSGRTLTAKAQRGVIFLEPGKIEQLGSLDARSVRGAYFEGDVSISNGDYNVRGPHVYYDFAKDRAIMLDAVFWTVDQTRNLPLYVRAKEVRQESDVRFSAKDATVTNSAFLSPELALGARSITLTRTPPAPATQDASAKPGSWQASASGITLRSSDTPLFWWPSYSGNPEEPMIKDIRIENRSGSGAAAKVRWNAFNLLNLEPVEGLSADLQTDLYAERGPGVGAKVGWETARHQGAVFAYSVPFDRGTDVLKPGTEIDQDNEFRGIVTASDRFAVNERWTILGELAAISDETFVDAFFEEAGETRREFTNRLRAERTENNTQLTLEARGSFHDFIANEWLLQSQGYSVSALPEATYVRLADDVLDRTNPGLLTYFSEYRAGIYRLSLDEVAARDRGFSNSFLSQRAFGIDPAQTLAEQLRARGLDEQSLTRLDTRHELVAKFRDGAMLYTPFVVGRASFYDRDFAGFSQTPGGNDATRLWTAAGVRVATSVQRVIDGVDSRLFDIHRLRHIVEPSITAWAAGTNVEAGDIPAYDANVDQLADGAAVRVGVNQVWQTYRGAPGRYASVDLLRVNTDFVFASDDTDPQTPIGRFFDARPEYSAMGNYFVGDAAYRLTDSFSLTGSTVFDFDTNQQDFTTAGLLIDHAPGFSTLIDYRFLNAQDSQILGLYGSYDLTEKYSFSFSPNYNASAGEFQSFFVGATRRFSAFSFTLSMNYDNITGETGFGLVFQPYGARGGGGIASGGAAYSSIYGGDGGL